MMKPQDIVKKVGPDRIRKAMESTNGDELKQLLESEGIVLTPEQLDFVAGGIGLDDWDYTCDNRPIATCN